MTLLLATAAIVVLLALVAAILKSGQAPKVAWKLYRRSAVSFALAYGTFFFVTRRAHPHHLPYLLGGCAILLFGGIGWSQLRKAVGYVSLD